MKSIPPRTFNWSNTLGIKSFMDLIDSLGLRFVWAMKKFKVTIWAKEEEKPEEKKE